MFMNLLLIGTCRELKSQHLSGRISGLLSVILGWLLDSAYLGCVSVRQDVARFSSNVNIYIC